MRSPMRLVVIGLGVAFAAAGAWGLGLRPAPTDPGLPAAAAPLTSDRLEETVWQAQRTLDQLIAGAEGQLPPEARQRRLRLAFDQVRALERLIPRDTFDVASVARQIGPDPYKLDQWVRIHTQLVS